MTRFLCLPLFTFFIMLCWSNGFRLVSVTLIKRSFSRRAALAPLGRKKDPKLGFNLRTRPTEGLQLAECKSIPFC